MSETLTMPTAATDPHLDLLHEVVSVIPDGRVRAGQQKMCMAVANAMRTGRHLVTEAGTGTGKSLAYLIPAVLNNEMPVVIATATRALQDQLIEQDIPRLETALGRRINAVTLKGRDTYICAQKIKEIRTEADETLNFDLIKTATDKELEALIKWADTSATGNVSELRFQPSDDAWGKLSVASTTCMGSTCPSADICFARHAMAAAAEAEIIIVTMHMYCLYSLGIPVLPKHDVVVLDEAHELEDIASKIYGDEITPAQLKRAVTGIKEWAGKNQITEARTLIDNFAEVLTKYGTRGLLPNPLPSQMKEPAEILLACVKQIADGAAPETPNSKNQKQARAHKILQNAVSKLATLTLLGDAWVSWVELSFGKASGVESCTCRIAVHAASKHLGSPNSHIDKRYDSA